MMETRTQSAMLLSLLMMKESDGEHALWVVQCLEFDVAAQGETIAEAQRSFEREFAAQMTVYLVNDQDPFSILQPAPERYWEMFRNGLPLKETLPIKKPSNLPPAWMISTITAQNIHVF